MKWWQRFVQRASGPISNRPLRVASVALVVAALGFTGLLRFSVDAGQSLLVGSQSSAAQTYAAFSKTFGSDPIVMVLTAHNQLAPYLEQNLERLGALEIDLAHDSRVAAVLGPGTVAGSLRQAGVAEVSKVLAEYPYFVAETDYLDQLQQGNTNQTQLTQRLQADIKNAQALLEFYVLKAAGDAHNARAQYTERTGDRVLDSREKAVDAAVGKDPLPPLWAQYLAGPGQTPDPAAAQQFFDRVTAAFGDCDDQVATVLKISASCQVFFERTLLDLPHCPPVHSQQFCDPKPQWAAVLPPPQGGDSHAIVTIRIKPQYVGDQNAITSLQQKINDLLSRGVSKDSYTSALTAQSFANLKNLGPLRPTECGGVKDAPCTSAYHDAALGVVIAGAPLLGHGVVNAMTQLLIILLPVALFVMALLLAGTFRVRGRLWPLLAAAAATALTVGVSLLTGTPVTPAVLAGTPVLIGLGVDYAVQLVARFAEERRRGAGGEAAVSTVLGSTGMATLVAATATLAGLVALVLLSQFDWGPLVAVPLVAQFALVLCGGVLVAWLGAVFIALPLAVWSDRRGAAPVPLVEPAPPAAAAERTVALADNWRGVAAPAAFLAVLGWVLLHFVPVQTDVQQLVSPALPELAAVNAVQAQTGYTNEIDLYVRGQVAGPYNQAAIPSGVLWQCQAAADVRTAHSRQVATATSIADFFIASASDAVSSTSQACVPPSRGAGASPSPSPSPSPSIAPSGTPSPRASPTAVRPGMQDVVPAGRPVPADAATTPSAQPASATPATPLPSPTSSPRASASPTPRPSAAAPKTQTLFLCQMRLFPLLSRTLVMDVGPDVQPCPAIDEYQGKFLTADTTPIDPSAARIALGVHAASVADEASLVNSLTRDVASAPNGLTVKPTGLAVLATTAYGNLTGGTYLLNLAPLILVLGVLLIVHRSPRRALLPLVPTVLAAGWGPLLLLLLGRLPGLAGATLGSLNPLTVVLGALVIALGTEFGVVLLGRFYEERERGLDPDAAAGAALAGVGRAIRVSAVTLAAGFGVLALTGLLPNSLPLIWGFGVAVVIDLGLAVLAVFGVMLPLAVALERHAPLVLQTVWAGASEPSTARPSPSRPAPEAPAAPAPVADAGVARRLPGVSGRRRPQVSPGDEGPAAERPPEPRRKPGISGRPRRRGPK